MSNSLIGLTYGALTVIAKADDYIVPSTQQRMKRWLCKCECGNIKAIRQSDLTRKNRYVSCGCKRKETSSQKNKQHNTYNLSGEYGIGYTSKGEEFYFDQEDYDLIKDYCWYITSKGYVSTTINKRTIKFHRLLFPDSQQIDHRNHKKNDNRKCNLREVTNTQNCINRSLQSNNTSGVTGVYWNKQSNKWVASITVDKKLIFLGYFNQFENAVQARKTAEEHYFGEYSYDNSVNYQIGKENTAHEPNIE